MISRSQALMALVYAIVGFGVGLSVLLISPTLLPAATIFVAISGVVYFLLFGDRSARVWEYMPITFIGSIIFVIYVEVVRDIPITSNAHSVGLGYVFFIASLLFVWHPVMYKIAVEKEDTWLRLNRSMLEKVRKKIVNKITRN